MKITVKRTKKLPIRTVSFDAPLYESPAVAIQRLSHDNWQIAEVYAEMWRKLDSLELIEREYIETHSLYSKRRPPNQGVVDALIHSSRQIAERAIPQEPVGVYPDGGFLCVRFQAVHQQYGPINIAIDADSRESAVLGYQMLMLMVQDPQIYHDLVNYRIHRIRFRQDLDQLGRTDGNGMFSIRTTQAIPWMCRVAAHQLGHYRYGDSDFEADAYARRYIHCNHLRFEQWRSQLPRPATDPREMMQHGLKIVQRHAPNTYQEIRGFRLEPNEQTPDADEYNIAHHLGFIALQRRTQRETGLPVPLEMLDCVAHRAVTVNRPLEVTNPDTGQVIPIERDRPPILDSERPGLLKELLFTYGGNTPQEGYHYGYYEIQSPEGHAEDCD
jgi:hypothetical protein